MFEFCDYEPCSFCKKWIDDGSVVKKGVYLCHDCLDEKREVEVVRDSTIQVFLLNDDVKKRIEEMVYNELIKEYDEYEADYYTQIAMDSRLCDLEEVILLRAIKGLRIVG